MAENFKILTHQNDDSLHLKLLGDFDGSSAHMLINTLKEHYRDVTRVFIHTSCLNCIIPFGRDVFLGKLGFLNKQSVHLVFTGDNAAQFSTRGVSTDAM